MLVDLPAPAPMDPDLVAFLQCGSSVIADPLVTDVVDESCLECLSSSGDGVSGTADDAAARSYIEATGDASLLHTPCAGIIDLDISPPPGLSLPLSSHTDQLPE